MLTPQSVSSLNQQIKSLLESTFLHVSVEGEVSRPTYHSSGHLYFTLKDKDASVSCVMFKGNNQKLRFRVEEGMAVCISGSISVYSPRGSYQINCVSMEPAGSGALAVAYEQLKNKLQAKGYFDPSRKKSLPRFPSHIALVTSATGAALQDMRHVAAKRWPMARLSLCDALVQGEGAAASIVRGIDLAQSLMPDVIIIGRGGGSVEDLWAFNEESVAEAVFTCTVPIVSAVGHEIDYVISDFVADVRAPTPSAAMEIVLPDQNELRMSLDGMMQTIEQLFVRNYHRKRESLRFLVEGFKQNTFDAKLSFRSREIVTCKEALIQKMAYLLQHYMQNYTTIKADLHNQEQRLLSAKSAAYQSLNMAFLAKEPSKEARLGYAQIVKEGKRVELETLHVGESVELQSPTTCIIAKVIEKHDIIKDQS